MLGTVFSGRVVGSLPADHSSHVQGIWKLLISPVSSPPKKRDRRMEHNTAIKDDKVICRIVGSLPSRLIVHLPISKPDGRPSPGLLCIIRILAKTYRA
jgi:hypothetical protein